MFSPTNYLIYHPRPQKEEAYGREWQKTEEFRRDEETSKADLREGIEEGIREELRSSHKESLEGVVKGEVAREEGASEEEVRGLSDYFREVSDEVTAVNDMWDLIDTELRRTKEKAVSDREAYRSYVEENYGRAWQKTEEFRRDDETARANLEERKGREVETDLGERVKASLEEAVKGEVALEKKASKGEVRGLSDYFREVSDEVTAEWEHRISIEDHLGGRVTIIPTEKLCVQLY